LRYAGIDLRHLAQAQWHQRIAWLPQNAPVFAGSVRDNLLIGDAAADDAALWQVLQQVRLGAWASANDGLDTWVGENSTTLSTDLTHQLAFTWTLLHNISI
ncbi:thiol reductant ABC exporter subunit CydC, partial [Xanthomonas perforans]|nr:thiol reductant ABC exporter subunit CydC [Xanthomonas perforans]